MAIRTISRSLYSIALVVLPGLAAAIAQGEESQTLRFNRDIRPILSAKCFACHGPDQHARQGDLRLDLAEPAQAVLEGGVSDSELIRRIESDDVDEQMPPPDSKLALTAEEKRTLRNWVAAGSPYEGHWSFLTPQRPPLPEVENTSWPRNPIDRFTLRRLEQSQLAPSPVADPYALIRRLTLDLTGLPPSVETSQAFARDPSDEAYESAVDRLLDSPQYGEHMARFWLDAARYADTNGYQYDLERSQWVWRDWVIHAFNSNMPYDEFTIQQLAGDLLPNATDQHRLATGFNRNHPITIEGGIIDEEYRTEYVVDRVVTTSTVWLGLTMTCSRCHDHKYDPVSQREFYQFFAFFNNVPERGMRGFTPQKQILSPLSSVDKDRIGRELAAATKEVDAAIKRQGGDFAAWEEQLRKQLEAGWKVAVPDSMQSAGGAMLSTKEDQSVLASGANPSNETYILDFHVGEEAIQAVRLDALIDPSTVNGGAGRGSNGNFVLTEFEATFSPPAADGQAEGGPAFQPVKIERAEADYSQKDYDISLAVDGKLDSKGWAVDGHEKIENRTATFVLQSPVRNARLRIKLIHRFGQSHQIARFRLAFWRQPVAPPSLEESKLLLMDVDKRDAPQVRSVQWMLARRFGDEEIRGALKKVRRLEAERSRANVALPQTMIMEELPSRRETHVLFRGEYDKPRELVTAGTPTALPPMRKDLPNNRLGLGKWLVSPEHPLTSRVTVNRYWAQLFGQGIVGTLEDFGSQGEWPSHPDLLDWLAVDFQETGWNVKRLLKTIVMSATYRQSGTITDKAIAADPENRLLTRGPRRRLDAEVIRDSALSASGLLLRSVGGPSVFPYHPQGLWQEINNRPGYSRTYKRDDGDGLYRRSLYTFWKRTVPPPSMAVFDAPAREFCTVRRSRTNTPLQAFVMLNDPQYVEAARASAERMLDKDFASDGERLQGLFHSLIGRPPMEAEQSALEKLLAKRRAHYRESPEAATALIAVGASKATAKTPELAAWTSIARVLINLSEFVTKP